MSSSPSIGAVLIAKNEEHVIGRCIKSLAGLAEVVVLDTGSTDLTVDVARKLGAKVTVREGAIKPFHFAQARNEALALSSCDWVLSIDADEVMRPGAVRKMAKAIQDFPQATAFTSTFINHPDGSGNSSVVIQKVKLFEKAFWTWRYRVHEQLVSTGDKPKHIGDLSSVSFEHLPPPEKTARHLQNIDLLVLCVQESPEYTRAFRHLGQELMLRKEWARAIPYLAHYAEKTEEGELHKSEGLMHIGRCYAELGRLDEGLKWFDLAFQTDPRRREPLYHGALNLIKAARLDEALTWVKRLMAVPVATRPNSAIDLPDAWGAMPIKMLSFCTAEIARAKASLEAQKA